MDALQVLGFNDDMLDEDVLNKRCHIWLRFGRRE